MTRNPSFFGSQGQTLVEANKFQLSRVVLSDQQGCAELSGIGRLGEGAGREGPGPGILSQKDRSPRPIVSQEPPKASRHWRRCSPRKEAFPEAPLDRTGQLPRKTRSRLRFWSPLPASSALADSQVRKPPVEPAPMHPNTSQAVSSLFFESLQNAGFELEWGSFARSVPTAPLPGHSTPPLISRARRSVSRRGVTSSRLSLAMGTPPIQDLDLASAPHFSQVTRQVSL